MALEKITEEEILEIKGDSAEEHYNAILERLEPYSKELKPREDPKETKFSIPSIHGMEVSVRFEMKGEDIYYPDPNKIGDMMRVINEGTPYLKVRLSYLETTSLKEIKEIKDLLVKD